MKLNDFQNLSKRTLPKRESLEEKNMALANYSIGLAGESGEAIDHVKKFVFHGHELNVEEVKKELGDVLHYLAGIATMCDLTLEEIATENITKLQKRFPKGFSKEASVNRLDVQEGN